MKELALALGFIGESEGETERSDLIHSIKEHIETEGAYVLSGGEKL